MVGQVLIYSLVQGTQVLVVALALFFVYSVSKVQNLAFGGIAAAGAYALYAAVHNGWGLALQIALPFLVVISLGILNFFLNERFTKRGEYLLALLTSFSLAIVIEEVIAIIFGTDGKSLTQGILPVVSFYQYQIPLPGLITLGFGLLVGIKAYLFLVKIPMGRALRAVSENQFSAASMGVHHSRMRLYAYIGAAIVAGAIGILAGLNTALTPMMGLPILLIAFIAFLVGGPSDIRGTIVASYLLSLLPEVVFALSPDISFNWRLFFVFVIAFMALAIRPNGIFSPARRIN